MNIPAEAPYMTTSPHYLWWKVTNILPELSTIPTYIVMYVTSLNCSENVMKKGVLKQELTLKLSSVPSITMLKHLLMLQPMKYLKPSQKRSLAMRYLLPLISIL